MPSPWKPSAVSVKCPETRVCLFACLLVCSLFCVVLFCLFACLLFVLLCFVLFCLLACLLAFCFVLFVCLLACLLACCFFLVCWFVCWLLFSKYNTKDHVAHSLSSWNMVFFWLCTRGNPLARGMGSTRFLPPSGWPSLGWANQGTTGPAWAEPCEPDWLNPR